MNDLSRPLTRPLARPLARPLTRPVPPAWTWGARVRAWVRRIALVAILALAGVGALSLAQWLDLVPDWAAPVRQRAPFEAAGLARAVDGDTLAIGADRIRLAGIDAPERAQVCGDAREHPFRCGDRARVTLADLVDGRPVRCAGKRRDRYRRLVATCLVGDTDLSRAMVASGWAVAVGCCESEQAQARGAARGLWAGRFEDPATWRRLRPTSEGRRADLLGLLRLGF